MSKSQEIWVSLKLLFVDTSANVILWQRKYIELHKRQMETWAVLVNRGKYVKIINRMVSGYISLYLLLL